MPENQKVHILHVRTKSSDAVYTDVSVEQAPFPSAKN